MMYRYSDEIRFFNLGSIRAIGQLKNGSIIGLDAANASILKARIGSTISLADLNNTLDPELVEALIEAEMLIENPSEVLEKDQCHQMPVSPSAAYVHLTDRCNLHCRGCYSLVDSRNEQCDLNLQHFERIFSELKQNGVKRIVLSGGEPLMHKDLQAILRLAKRQFQFEKIDLITNGTLASHYPLETLKGLVDHFSVSIDGYSEEHPQFIRDPGIYENVLEGIRKIKASGFSISILPTLHHQNGKAINQYVQMAEREGVNISFSLLSCQPQGFEDLILQEEDLITITHALIHKDQEIMVEDSPLNYDLSVGSSCGLCKHNISVSSDGTVYPCHMLHDQPYALGNVLETSLESILSHNPKASHFQNLSVDDFQSCSHCEYKYLCAGGCRARALFVNEEIKAQDPYCVMYKTYFKSFIRSVEEAYQ